MLHTVKVPADRRITLEVPPQIPAGTTASFELIWFPVGKMINNLGTTLDEIQELCKDSTLTVDSFLEMRRKENEKEENQYRQFISGLEVEK